MRTNQHKLAIDLYLGAYVQFNLFLGVQVQWRVDEAEIFR